MEDNYFMTSLRYFWLDSSALVKIFIDEPGSQEIRKVFRNFHQNNFITSEFCVYEFYNVLKRKFLKDKVIGEEQYLKSIFIMSIHIRQKVIRYLDHNESPESIFLQTQNVLKKYGFDYADAIQFVLIKKGILGFLAGESRPILVTSDKDMIKAANTEGIGCWNPESESFDF